MISIKLSVDIACQIELLWDDCVFCGRFDQLWINSAELEIGILHTMVALFNVH